MLVSLSYPFCPIFPFCLVLLCLAFLTGFFSSEPSQSTHPASALVCCLSCRIAPNGRVSSRQSFPPFIESGGWPVRNTDGLQWTGPQRDQMLLPRNPWIILVLIWVSRLDDMVPFLKARKPEQESCQKPGASLSLNHGEWVSNFKSCEKCLNLATMI